MSLALVPLQRGHRTTLNPSVDPCDPPSDTADGSTADNSNAVTLPGPLLSSMWALIRPPVGAIQWGRTLHNMLGHSARAVHEAFGDRAHNAGRGPHAVADKIIGSFGTGSVRVRNLAIVQRQLNIQEEQHTTEEQDDDDEPNIDLSELRKQCSEFVRYTLREERADMQCQAFQRLVQLTTLFPGLRLMLLLSKHIQPPKSTNLQDMLSKLWDRSHPILPPDDESEWRFWRSFAEICLSESSISLVIERCPITQVALCKGTPNCVIGELLIRYSSCENATEISSALCIRYLGQIVTLVEFWAQVKAADSVSDCAWASAQKLCLGLNKTLQDLQPGDSRPLPFDYEGFDFLASRILDEVIGVLQRKEANSAGHWYAPCKIVVRLLRDEWCKIYLQHSYLCAHHEVLKDWTLQSRTNVDGPGTAEIQELPGTGVDDAAATEMQGNIDEARTPEIQKLPDTGVDDAVATEMQGSVDGARTPEIQELPDTGIADAVATEMQGNNDGASMFRQDRMGLSFDNLTETEVVKFHAMLLQILGILELITKTQTAQNLTKDKDVPRGECRKLCRMMNKKMEAVSTKVRSFHKSGDPNQLKAYDSRSPDVYVPAVESCRTWCHKISNSLKATSYIAYGPLSWKYLRPGKITRDSDKKQTKEALEEIHSFAELLRLTVPSPSSSPAATNSAPSTTPPIAHPAIGAPLIAPHRYQFCPISHTPIARPAIDTPVIAARRSQFCPFTAFRPHVDRPLARFVYLCLPLST
ncbi:hypothetical protein MSAN_00831900 [Mycena sanguinolenta]|uniref:Uncharacterized protein n=1 Tax=Mycena sanguinolenta TaxID=230812 RepID=A0A8H6YYT1_9AGAR|nr:hypothetical protein MSAN_00831900 [Mycena sanguinolenta]